MECASGRLLSTSVVGARRKAIARVNPSRFQFCRQVAPASPGSVVTEGKESVAQSELVQKQEASFNHIPARGRPRRRHVGGRRLCCRDTLSANQGVAE